MSRRAAALARELWLFTTSATSALSSLAADGASALASGLSLNGGGSGTRSGSASWTLSASTPSDATLLAGAMVALVTLAVWTTWRVAQRRATLAMRRAQAAMAFARAQDAKYTSVESGMLEWINQLLRHEWRTVGMRNRLL